MHGSKGIACSDRMFVCMFVFSNIRVSARAPVQLARRCDSWCTLKPLSADIDHVLRPACRVSLPIVNLYFERDFQYLSPVQNLCCPVRELLTSWAIKWQIATFASEKLSTFVGLHIDFTAILVFCSYCCDLHFWIGLRCSTLTETWTAQTRPSISDMRFFWGSDGTPVL